jgi:hypothetical protein
MKGVINNMSNNTDGEGQFWFYLTRGMIRGLCTEYKVPDEAQIRILQQFNLIGPKFGVSEADLTAEIFK